MRAKEDGPVAGPAVLAEAAGPDRARQAAPKGGGRAAEERFLRHALLLVRGEERGYLELFRAATGDGPSPEEFCREVLQRLAEPLGFSQAAEWIGLADRVTDRDRGTAFLDLLAAQAAADAWAWEPALRLAQRATARSQRSVHAHTLFVRARAALEGTGPAREEDLSALFCPRPFEDVEVTANGDVHTCCPAWLPAPIGNIHRQGWEEIWNSAAAQAVRGSILDGDYRYCSRLHCPLVVAKRLPRRDELKDPRHRRIVAERLTVLPERPRRVLMSQDRTCNLSCPSCRTSVFTARKDELDRLNSLAETVILPMLAEAEEVKVTGSGDPFASAHFRHLLKRLNRRDFPRLKVTLQTNGLLFDAKAWADLGLDGLVRDVWVSIDAATPGTYEILRRGGRFERLLSNLAFVAGLRRAGRIGGLRLDFVVQRRNYREMPAAVELGRAFGVDRVHFQMIRNWGTFTPAEFQAEYVGAPDHPEYGDLLTVLRHPSLRPPFVDLSTLGALYERAAAGPSDIAA